MCIFENYLISSFLNKVSSDDCIVCECTFGGNAVNDIIDK
jgi:hypothetical protein